MKVKSLSTWATTYFTCCCSLAIWWYCTYALYWRPVQFRNTKYRGVCTRDWLCVEICMSLSLRRWAFVRIITMGSTLQYSVGVATEFHGFPVLRAYIKLGMDYCPLHGVAGCPLIRGCIRICMEKRSGLRTVRCIVGVRRWGMSLTRGSTVR